MSWYSDLLDAGASAYGSTVTADANKKLASAINAQNAANSSTKPNWMLIGGIGAAIVVVLLVVMSRK